MVKIITPHNFAEIKHQRCNFESEEHARNIVQLKPVTKLALTLGELGLTEPVT